MPSKNEVALLRDQITEEVNRDAEVIGTQLFAQAAGRREPDVSRVSEETLRQIYRQKYLAQDREWLTNEAQRDPKQFLRVAQSIGAMLPERLPETMQPPPGSLPQGPVAPPPTAVPSMLPPGQAAAPPGIQAPIDPALAAAALQQAILAASGQQPVLAGPQIPPSPLPMAPQPTIVPQVPPGS